MRPPILCRLQKGLILDANIGFVDTYNWMLDFICNLCGDGDLDNDKPIVLDRTIDDRPVIRGNGAAGGGGCWKIVVGSRNGEVIHVFANQFYSSGNAIRELELDDAVEDFVCQGELADGYDYTADDEPFVALKVPATANPAEGPELAGYKSLEEMQAAQEDPAYIVKPLYKFKHGGAVAVDFRNCPQLQVAEVM